MRIYKNLHKHSQAFTVHYPVFLLGSFVFKASGGCNSFARCFLTAGTKIIDYLKDGRNFSKRIKASRSFGLFHLVKSTHPKMGVSSTGEAKTEIAF